MLIDSDIAHESESLGMVANDDIARFGIPSHQERTLNGGARRRSADDASTIEYRLDFALCQRIEIGVSQPPLSTFPEENTASAPQRLHKFFCIRDLSVIGV